MIWVQTVRRQGAKKKVIEGKQPGVKGKVGPEESLLLGSEQSEAHTLQEGTTSSHQNSES